MSSTTPEKKPKKAPPSFAKPMPGSDVRKSSYEGGDETTRRIGGSSHGGGLISPSFATIDAVDQFTTTTTAPNKPSTVVGDAPSPPRPSAGVWVHPGDVPSLPEMHRLERTAVFVEKVSPNEICERVANVLRARSIAAQYDARKASAACTTNSGVELCVRLYRGRGPYQHGIIVEVQRHFGMAMSVHSDVQAILDAAQGQPVTELADGDGDDCLPLVSLDEHDYNVDMESLLTVGKLLSHGGGDSLNLALQMLDSMTDVRKMGKATARCISNELLKADSTVGSKVLALAVDQTSTIKDLDDTFPLHVMSMNVIANVLSARSPTLDMDDVMVEQLRPIILRDLGRAQSNPRAAMAAARCLEHLLSGDHQVGDLAAPLHAALQVGQARHAGLERQAQLCLNKAGL